jgi:hypothetical protein
MMMVNNLEMPSGCWWDLRRVYCLVDWKEKTMDFLKVTTKTDVSSEH